MTNAIDSLRHLIDCYGWRDSRDMQDFIDAADAIDSQYVELPKDADGEYIHIGDRVEDNERVARIVITDDDWEPSVYIEKLPNVLLEHFCSEIAHYHPDTWEQIEQDARKAMSEYSMPNVVMSLIARCKALAGDAE